MTKWIDLDYLDDAPDYQKAPYYKAVDTLTLGELIEHGWFDLSREDWQYDYYSEEQRNRLNAKIVNRFFFNEISCTPLLKWKMLFLEKLNEIMPKYKLVYKLIENGFSPVQVEDRYQK